MPATPQGLLIPQIDPTTVAVPAAGFVSLVADPTGRLTIIKSDATINPINPTNQISDPQIVNSAAAGNTVIGPGIGDLVAVVNVTGLANVRTFSLNTVGLTSANAGFKIKIVFLFPGQLSGIGLQVFNANTLGANLLQTVTDGIQNSLVFNGHFDGAAWQVDDYKYPATT